MNNINKDFIKAVGTAFNFVGPAAICGLLAAALIFCFLVPGSAASAAQVGTGNSSRPVIYQFTATHVVINYGEKSSLMWNVSDAIYISIDPGNHRIIVDANNGGGRCLLNGSLVVYPAATTNYTLKAANAEGNATANTSIIVNEVRSPVIGYFKANPSVINAGEGAMLSWPVSSATEASISGIGNVALTGSLIVKPAQTTTYFLTARSGNKIATSGVSVEVSLTRPSPPVIGQFRAYPGRIESGQGSTLSWGVDRASSVWIDNGIGYVGPSGSILVSPSGTTVYTLRAANPAGSVVASVQVSVAKRVRPPVINYFAIDKSVISAGDIATLSWSVSGATQVSISKVGGVSSDGMTSVMPSSTTSYTLTASNSGGAVRGTVAVEVGQIAIQPINPVGREENPKDAPVTIF